jgi:hypothetical protein
MSLQKCHVCSSYYLCVLEFNFIIHKYNLITLQFYYVFAIFDILLSRTFCYFPSQRILQTICYFKIIFFLSNITLTQVCTLEFHLYLSFFCISAHKREKISKLKIKKDTSDFVRSIPLSIIHWFNVIPRAYVTN